MQSANGFFGSGVLEVVIGLSFLFFLLSVIASSVNELVAAWLKWRAKDLEAALLAILGPGLFTEVANHPLVSAMGQNLKAVRGAQQAEGAQQLPGRPSYLPARTFALALLDAVANNGMAAGADRVTATITAVQDQAKALARNPQDRVGRALQTLLAASRDPNLAAQRLEEVKAALTTLPTTAEQQDVQAMQRALAEFRTLAVLKAALPTLLEPDAAWTTAAQAIVGAAEEGLETAAAELNRLQKNVEMWFDNAMDRVSGVYKRHVLWFLFVVGLLLALVSGADALRFASTLYTNTSLRTAVVAAAQDQTRPPPTIPEVVDQLAPFSLLFGYADLPAPSKWEAMDVGSRVSFVFQKAVGELITAFAIALGAPFWFQVLQKAVSLRGAGPKPTSESDSLEAAKERKAAAPGGGAAIA
jgi:hypothetical protein